VTYNIDRHSRLLSDIDDADIAVRDHGFDDQSRLIRHDRQDRLCVCPARCPAAK
jgi:hypothetical protein